MDGEESIKVEIDVRSRSPSEEPVDLPAGVQDQIDVMCGDARGVMNVKRARVLYEGEDISPTEFEKIGGRAASKKWKTSLRIVNPDGRPGQLIGDWLQSHGVDIKHSHVVRYTGKPSPPPSRPQRPPPILRPPMAKPPPVMKTPSAPKPSRPNPAAKPHPVLQKPSVDLLVHLQSQYIGYIPGDPTVEGVPAELPASSISSPAPDLTVIDMDRISHEELMKLSHDSAPDPLGALLPNQPGILPEREAHLTGHQPAKRPRATLGVDANEAASLVGDYMAGRLSDFPWQAFGLSRVPLICGVDLDLHKFYKAVQSHGGFEATISNKCWGKVATKLGIEKSIHTNSSTLLRNTYSKFLLAYETQVRALRERESSEQLPALNDGDQQTEAQGIGAPSGIPLQDAPQNGDPEAEDQSDDGLRAAEVLQEVSDNLEQPADAGAPGGAAEQARDDSRGAFMDDRPLPEREPDAVDDAQDADAVAPGAACEQKDEPPDGSERQPREFDEVNQLNADSGIDVEIMTDVDIISLASSTPDSAVVLD